jgi:hypothetical protein
MEKSEADQEKPAITPTPPLSTLDDIPWFDNLLASIFTWLLLAGYVVLPGAFTTIRKSRFLLEEAGAAGKTAVKATQTLPILIIAPVICFFGVAGMCWLGWRWKSNYIWLLTKIIE